MTNTRRQVTIRLNKEYMNFSAAHFTIFSASQRERVHGHNFRVDAEITTDVGEDGLCIDYRILKKILLEICNELDEYFLIPEHSPHLKITSDDSYYRITFNNEEIVQLISDTKLLPLTNITVEELSFYILGQLSARLSTTPCDVSHLKIGVSSGDGQWGYSLSAMM